MNETRDKYIGVLKETGINFSDPSVIHTLNTVLPFLVSVQEFVKEETREYDESHGFNHAEKVAINTFIIAFHDILHGEIHLKYVPALPGLLMIAYLHDVCDHKYPGYIEKVEKRNNFIEKWIRENEMTDFFTLDQVVDIINSISWSKQHKGITDTSDWSDIDLYLLGILRDADRLEAIGKIGVERCIEFSRNKMKNASEEEIMRNVLEHCEEKLLIMYPTYFSTKKGLELAKPLHEEIVDFYKCVSEKKELSL